MKEKKSIINPKLFYLWTITTCLCFLIIYNVLNSADVVYEEKWTYDENVVKNYYIMRDLFTPMYQDTVTIENAGFKPTVYDWENNTKISEGGMMFWVNHSRVLSSFYFEDKNCYKILIPNNGEIELIN